MAEGTVLLVYYIREDLVQLALNVSYNKIGINSVTRH